MIRVLQMAGLSRGGLETFVMNVYRKIDRTKIQFDFLVNDANADYAEEVRELGGRIYEIPARNKGFFVYYKNLDLFFKEHAHEYVAVHLHISSLSMASNLYFARKYGIKTRILHSHSTKISGNKLNYCLHYATKPFVKGLASHYFGCSDKALNWFYNGTGVRQKAKMINNGIDVDLFHYNPGVRTRIREELGIGDNCVLGHVGRFITVKNHRFLLEIFSSYHKINPQSKLLLIGDGVLKEEINEYVSSMGLRNDVIFTGVRSDICDLMQVMDIFVMPSFYEGLPVTLVEAQTAGLPILASDTISRDTKMTESLHYMSLVEDSGKWADKIDTLLSDFVRKDNSETIRENGFDICTTANLLTEIYVENK